MEEKPVKENNEELDYEKSKEYWTKIEATNSGMLGNLTHISLCGIN